MNKQCVKCENTISTFSRGNLCLECERKVETKNLIIIFIKQIIIFSLALAGRAIRAATSLLCFFILS